MGMALGQSALEARFVGRSDELRELLALFDASRSERRPRFVVLEGAAGIGKSRLLREFVAAARSAAPAGAMDDRWLYMSNWLHGDLRRYDISDRAKPRLASRLWLGGVIGHPTDHPRGDLNGGPQMMQVSLDGKRLFVTNSLYSTWDNQFYPDGLRSWLLKVDCADDGSMTIDPAFFVDFHGRPGGPARAHEVRLEGGDCTTEIFP
jgi:hypothetical protein